jgi:hypothetical protein
MALPNHKAIVEEAIRLYPDAFTHAHREGDPRTEEFVNLLVQLFRDKGHKNVFLNGKRGTTDVSDDCIAWVDPEGDVISREGERFYIVDVIVGAGGTSPSAAWSNVSGPSPGRLIEPKTPGATPTPTPCPDPARHQKPDCPDPQAHRAKTYPGDRAFDVVGQQLEADYAAAGQTLNAQSATWVARTIWDHLNEGLSLEASIAKHRHEWRSALGLGD